MTKEWWENTIDHFEKMSMDDFKELVEKVDKVQLPIIDDNIILPEKPCTFHHELEKIKHFLHTNKEE
jgi:hypothetical protein